jgi:S-(hydroxymethyl)mycothiol dehydrogenase
LAARKMLRRGAGCSRPYPQGRLDLDAFVSEEIERDEVEAAFERIHHGDVLRSVVIL